MTEIHRDSAESTAEGVTVSGHSMSRGTITVSSTQDNVGNVVHTELRKDSAESTSEGRTVSGHFTLKGTHLNPYSVRYICVSADDKLFFECIILVWSLTLSAGPKQRAQNKEKITRDHGGRQQSTLQVR